MSVKASAPLFSRSKISDRDHNANASVNPPSFRISAPGNIEKNIYVFSHHIYYAAQFLTNKPLAGALSTACVKNTSALS